jgi:hypothetical protein
MAMTPRGRKKVLRKRPRPQAKKAIRKVELDELKSNINLVKEELNPKRDLIFGDQSKVLLVNIPGAVENGLYDAYLLPQRRRRLKAQSQELIDKVDALEQRKFKFILESLAGRPIPPKDLPKSISELIEKVGPEFFVKEGTQFIFLENKFSTVNQKEIKRLLEELLSFSQRVLRSVRKR